MMKKRGTAGDINLTRNGVIARINDNIVNNSMMDGKSKSRMRATTSVSTSSRALVGVVGVIVVHAGVAVVVVLMPCNMIIRWCVP
jgi:hypothetical protein